MNRIVFITLEFSAGVFSGNGIYAQSQVRSLANQPDTELLVVSGKPRGAPQSTGRHNAIKLIEVEVPRWGRLDSSAPWEEFARNAGSTEVTQAVQAFDPTTFLFVDWSALPALRSIRSALRKDAPCVYLNYRVFSRTEVGEGKQLVQRLETEAMAESAATVVLSASDRDYLLHHVANFPVNSSSPGTCMPPSKAPRVLLCALREELNSLPIPADLGLSKPAEPGLSNPGDLGLNSLGRSNEQVENHNEQEKSLSEQQCTASQSHQGIGSCAGLGQPTGAAVPSSEQHLAASCPLTQAASCPLTQAASCPLTQAAGPGLGEAVAAFRSARPFLTCCVRLSREKEPERFVDLVEQLVADGSLRQHSLTPLLVGATNDAYAQEIKGRLRKVAPDSMIIEQFMGPKELATQVFSRTRLNVHPCTYDAFGMTICEASSMGAPSVVHSRPGAIGATDLLQASNGEVVLHDMTQPVALAAHINDLLSDGERLLGVARKAVVRARSWTEATNAQALLSIIREATAR